MSDFAQTDLSALLSALDRYSSLTVWVVGDLMLDEYVMGAVERVSPEAPVPVVRVPGSAKMSVQPSSIGIR